jgi:hypothetical protein
MEGAQTLLQATPRLVSETSHVYVDRVSFNATELILPCEFLRNKKNCW